MPYGPHAKRVSVIGEFNEWDFDARLYERGAGSNCYLYMYCSGVKEGDMYKFCIETQHGKRLLKPIRLELCGTSSGKRFRVTDISHFKWEMQHG